MFKYYSLSLFTVACMLIAGCNSSEVAGTNAVAQEDTQETAAPNIILFVADDLGWSDVSYQGSEIQTPELDRLAAGGARFDRFYAQPLCSPTRGAIMTGRSPVRTGVLKPFEPWYEEGLPLNEKILPQYFKEEGYDTYAIGKWHLGPNHVSYHPQNRGFDYFYGSVNGFFNHYTHAVWRGVDWQRNGETVIEEGYSTELIADDVIRIIQSQDENTPLLLYVAMQAPHTPHQAPEAAIAEYAHIEDETRRVFAAMVSEMDRQIARVMTALDDSSMADNTLVMFISDNGGNENLGANNGEYRGGKTSPLEGGIHVPALMYWPGQIAAGTEYADLFAVEDILPTFLGVAGVDQEYPLPIDGVNKWPAISQGIEVEDNESILVKWSDAGADYDYAYFKDDWKMVQLMVDGTKQHSLFSILEDPYEQNDLAAEFPEVVTDLVNRFEAIPKGKVAGLGSPPPPTITGLGGPGSIEADFRPLEIPPYTETMRTD